MTASEFEGVSPIILEFLGQCSTGGNAAHMHADKVKDYIARGLLVVQSYTNTTTGNSGERFELTALGRRCVDETDFIEFRRNPAREKESVFKIGDKVRFINKANDTVSKDVLTVAGVDFTGAILCSETPKLSFRIWELVPADTAPTQRTDDMTKFHIGDQVIRVSLDGRLDRKNVFTVSYVSGDKIRLKELLNVEFLEREIGHVKLRESPALDWEPVSGFKPEDAVEFVDGRRSGVFYISRVLPWNTDNDFICVHGIANGYPSYLLRPAGAGKKIPMKAQEILRNAADIVSGARQVLHGPARSDFTKIATLWNAYQGARPAGPLNDVDVAIMMVLLKVARSQSGAHNPDDYLDMCGYAAIAGELAAHNAG